MSEVIKSARELRAAIETIDRQLRNEANFKVEESFCEVVQKSIEAKDNASGVNAWITQKLLDTYLQTYPIHVLVDTTIASSLFHRSMAKQYMVYLASNERSICIGEIADQPDSRCPNVSSIFECIQGRVSENPRVGVHLVKEFLLRLVSTEKLSKRCGFLYSAKICRLIGRRGKEQVVEILETAIRGHKLYQPSVYQTQIHLEFLKWVVDLTFKRISERKKKKRKVDNAGARLRLSRAMLEIDHRALEPVLPNIFAAMDIESTDLLLTTIDQFSKARKWKLVMISILKASEVNRQLCSILNQGPLLEQICKSTSELPTLEVQDFVNEVVLGLSQDRLTDEVELFPIKEAIVRSLHITEGNSLDVSKQIAKLMPAADALRMIQGRPTLIEALNLCLSVHRCIARCGRLHPLVSSEETLLNIAVEDLASISRVETWPREENGETIVLDCLLERLNSIYSQTLFDASRSQSETGQRVAKLSIEWLRVQSPRCVYQALNEYFSPITTFVSRADLISLSRRILKEAIRGDREWTSDMERLFGDPMSLQSTKFIDCFRSAFLDVVQSSLESDFAEIAKVSSIKTILDDVLNKSPTSRPRNVGDHSGVLDLLRFGLRLPPRLWGEYRVQLEVVVMALSTVTTDRSLFDCVSHFSLTSIEVCQWKLDYIPSAFKWIIHLGKVFHERGTRYQQAFFAILKQLVFYRCLSKDQQSPTITLDLIFEDIKSSPDEISVLTRFCRRLLESESQNRRCLKGKMSQSWVSAIKRHLQKEDLQFIFQLLQSKVVPVLDDFISSHPGFVGEMISDLAVTSLGDKSVDVGDISEKLLSYISMARWTSQPEKFDGIAHFLQHLWLLTEKSAITEDSVTHQTELQLRLFKILVKTAADFKLDQSSDNRNAMEFSDGGTDIRFSFLDAFHTFLSIVQDELKIKIMHYLLAQLQSVKDLEDKFSILELLSCTLHHINDPKQLSSACRILYQCFWDGHIRHVLLGLAERKKRKQVAVPNSNQTDLFVGILSSYLRAFSTCHLGSTSIEQRATIQILRRIKRLIEALYSRSSFADLPHAAVWFIQSCHFLVAAIKHQKSTEAARALFPSFRSASESLLALFLAWKLSSTQSNKFEAAVNKAEMNLATIYSETSSCSRFKAGLPHLLLSYMSTVDSLRTRVFPRHSPLTKSTIEKEYRYPLALPTLKRGILTLYQSLSQSQINSLVAQVASNDHLYDQLRSLSAAGGRFVGHDG